jgi:hypothetical protein
MRFNRVHILILQINNFWKTHLVFEVCLYIYEHFFTPWECVDIDIHSFARDTTRLSHLDIIGNFSNSFIIIITTSVASAVCPSVTTSSTDFSSQNLVFFGVYLNFQ